MSISIKDFYSYVKSTSQNKDFEFLIAIPIGGGNYELFNITKENLFKLTGQSIDFTTNPGSNDIFDFDSGSARLVYINPGVFLLEASTFGISTNGTFNVVQLNDDGSIQLGNPTNGINGELNISDNNFNAELTRSLDSNITDELALIGDQGLGVSSPTNGSTVVIPNEYNRFAVLDIAGGAIATLTIELPASPRDNQRLRVIIYGSVDAITMDGNGNTINSPIASAAGDVTIAEWSYNESDTTWYKTSSDSGTSSNLEVVVTTNAGTTNIVNAYESTVFLDSTGTGTVYTLNFPTPPVDMQKLRITTDRGIASLIFATTDGSTINNNPSGSVSALDNWEWQYDLASDTWLRIR